MAITVLHSDAEQASLQLGQTLTTKIFFIVGLFLLLLASFCFQTEFTSLAYKEGFKEPIFLLFATHGMWWILWPLQALAVSLWRTFNKFRRDKSTLNQKSTLHIDPSTAASNNIGAGRYQRLDMHSQLLESQPESVIGGESDSEQITIPITTRPFSYYYSYFKKCIIKQFHNVYHTSILIYESNVNQDVRTENLNLLVEQNAHLSQSNSIIACVKSLFIAPAYRYIAVKTFFITLVLTVAGLTWYASMSMTYPSDVTAIYNCSAFTAYAFAIPILGEKFKWLKVSSVIIALIGVFIVAYSGNDSPGPDTEYPYRFWGNLLILVGAILYGYYEVIYKKYTCVGPHLAKVITPRRQATFANFVMAHLGGFTFLIVGLSILVVHVFGIHKFNLFDYGDKTSQIWGYISILIVSNLLFSALFLSLMALTSPVLSSVSSLLTIFLIGLVEWVVYGTVLSFQQLIGDVFVIVGFAILTVASWNEISEGTDSDDVEAISTYSFAVSMDSRN